MSKILFLGYTSNSFSAVNNVSFLYKNGNDTMLVDCGSTIPFNLHLIVKSLTEINCCFISHSHFDHFLGLPYFLIGRNLDAIAKIKKDPNYIVPTLNIIMEKKLQPLLLELLHTCHPDIKNLKYKINFIDLLDLGIIDMGNFKLFTKKMNHTVDTYGFYIIEDSVKVISYSSDTLFDNNMTRFFEQSKYLILEGMVPCREEIFSKTAKHATFDDAVRVANKISATFTFVVHLQPRYLDSLEEIKEYLECKGKNIGFPKVGKWYVLHI